MKQTALCFLAATIVWCSVAGSIHPEPRSEIYRTEPTRQPEPAIWKGESCKEKGYAVYKSCEMAKVRKGKG